MCAHTFQAAEIEARSRESAEAAQGKDGSGKGGNKDEKMEELLRKVSQAKGGVECL